jgi:hypothetical protein
MRKTFLIAIAIFAALMNFPEARAAVTTGLRQLEARTS